MLHAKGFSNPQFVGKPIAILSNNDGCVISLCKALHKATGFPSPAADFMETNIDLNAALSENPLATFYIRVNGNSMIDAGINDKDVLVVDRSLESQNNKIAICFIDGEFTVKRIKLETDCLYLMP